MVSMADEQSTNPGDPPELVVLGAQQPESPTGSARAGYGPFAYLSAEKAALYRRVMQALMAEKERFAVHVRPDQVHRRLMGDGGAPVDEADVAELLDRLAQPSWRNLLAFPDASRVTAVEDFYRRRMLYQISREGEAAERALAHYDEALGSRGALQSVALEDIIALLQRLQELWGSGTASQEAQLVHETLRSLRDRFTGLAENAVAFMASIQRTIDLYDADVEAFIAYKGQLIEYLDRFIKDLLVRGATIADLIETIDQGGVQDLIEIAVGREVLDVAPGEAATPETVRARWLAQWSGLRLWFIGTPERESEAKLLRARARSAIPSLLAVVRALHDRTGGRADRTQDYLTLARWFAALPTDADRHRLWRSAFGLTSVRHLSVTAETEDAWESARLGNATPWAEAPPLTISPQLRRSGSYERRGKPARVIDRSRAKEDLAARARYETEQTALARQKLLTRGPRPLSAFNELDPEAFRLFLALLGDGLAAMGPTLDRVCVHTSDGELVVTISRPVDDARAVVHTRDGDLSGPDYVVDIAEAAP